MHFTSHVRVGHNRSQDLCNSHNCIHFPIYGSISHQGSKQVVGMGSTPISATFCTFQLQNQWTFFLLKRGFPLELLHSRQTVQRGPRWTKERDTVPTKLNYKMNHSATFKCTKIIIHPLQPSCDAQDTAICWQVDQKGHTSQQELYMWEQVIRF